MDNETERRSTNGQHNAILIKKMMDVLIKPVNFFQGGSVFQSSLVSTEQYKIPYLQQD